MVLSRIKRDAIVHRFMHHGRRIKADLRSTRPVRARNLDEILMPSSRISTPI
jgi:hypothetical protein